LEETGLGPLLSARSVEERPSEGRDRGIHQRTGL